MNAELRDLTRLSARLGRDPLRTQAAGGNTSLKRDGVMWIKASGTWLADADGREIMVPVRLKPLLAALAHDDDRADTAMAFVVDGRNPQALRPSVETPVHAVIPWPVVVHIHCVATIALAVRTEPWALIAERLRSESDIRWAFVPYIRPGVPLARVIAQLDHGTNVIILGNHGLVIAANTVEEAEGRLERVIAAFEAPRRAERVADLADLTRLAEGSPYRLPRDPIAHDVATDPASLAIARKGTLYPDHVVFLGPGIVVPDGDETPAGFAGRLKAAGRPLPPMLVVPGQGVLLLHEALRGADELARGLAEVTARIPADAEVHCLSTDQEAELVNWDAEVHRLAQARAEGAANGDRGQALEMAGAETVAVLDVGKSNVKLALVDPRRRTVLDMRTTPNAVRKDGPYPHFDVDRLWAWFLDGLAELSATASIDVIATTTHGACFAVVAGDGLALPILDYEFAGPDAVHDAYRRVRGDFAETLSPDLPGGLNAGRQLFWLSETFPDAFARADAILPYPQYWTMRLTGAKVAEATSFGTHTDLWNPRAATFSRLAEDRGWAARIPPLVKPWETVGPVLPEVAARTGLSSDCRILAGIHDSNAALLPHMLWRPLPFAVLSTGTWMITFAAGGSLDDLDQSRDCLANVDVFVRPVPSAMCMAGREFELLTDGAAATPSPADIERVVANKIMALPSFVAGSGPYGRRKGGWSTEPHRLSPGERSAAASLYAAMIADSCLHLTGADGPIVIEGPFARNDAFLGALTRLTGRDVLARPDAAGTTLGAALLALGPDAEAVDDADPEPAAPIAIDIAAYAEEWRGRSER